MGRWFGTDGIRGKANTYPMDAATALAVGQAIAAHYKAPSGRSHIVLGRDTRLSGEMLASAVAAGICSMGVDVAMLGVLPTPGVAHAVVNGGAAAGVVLSASHNPYVDNGIKVFGPDGIKPSEQAESEIEELLEGVGTIKKASPDRIGRVNHDAQALERYLNFLSSVFHGSLKHKKIVLDCANGATWNIAPRLFRRLEADLTALYCEPDGLNINEQCGSQHPEKLAAAVLANQAETGLAFDGDGDRLIAVDDKGRILSGDQVIAICAQDLFSRNELRNNIVVATVMSNMGLHQAMSKLGASLLTTPVGDRHVMEKMVGEDAILGGEDSGHLIFRQHHTTGDGILAALMLLGVIQRSGRPLSELADQAMTVFPQVLINVDVREKPELVSIPRIAAAMRQAEEELAGRGRILVRYSGTQNQCRVMVEGPTQAQTQTICEGLATVIKTSIGK